MTAYGSVLTAGYTGDGLRAWKQNSGGRSYFLYDGILPVVELNSSGALTATNTLGATGLVSRRTGSASVLYSFDSEGNVAQRSDGSGTVLANHFFSAHGTVLSGSLSDPFGYQAQFGYYTDVETGLQLLTYRYYDFQLGRFLTRDSIGYSGGVNLYAYVANNPSNLSDPEGTQVRSDRNFWPGEIPSRPRVPDRTQRQPVGNPRPFNDGGIFSAATFAEFISANERARQPCKRFGERFWESFSDTNRMVPGLAAPVGTGLITSGKLAEIAGQPTIFQWASSGFTPGSALGGIITPSRLKLFGRRRSL